VVRRRDDGARILNALVTDSIVDPSFTGIPAAVHQAAVGHPAALDRFVDGVDRGESAPAALLSQGLHEATLCLDLAAPWTPRASQAQRAEAVARLAEQRGADTAFFPFDRVTATGNGIPRGCSEWPATDPPDLPAGAPATPLPHVPVLLFDGEHDL